MSDIVLFAIENLTSYGTTAEKTDLQYDARQAYLKLKDEHAAQAATIAQLREENKDLSARVSC